MKKFLIPFCVAVLASGLYSASAVSSASQCIAPIFNNSDTAWTQGRFLSTETLPPVYCGQWTCNCNIITQGGEPVLPDGSAGAWGALIVPGNYQYACSVGGGATFIAAAATGQSTAAGIPALSVDSACAASASGWSSVGTAQQYASSNQGETCAQFPGVWSGSGSSYSCADSTALTCTVSGDSVSMTYGSTTYNCVVSASTAQEKCTMCRAQLLKAPSNSGGNNNSPFGGGGF